MFFRNVLWVGCIKVGFKNEQMAGTIKVHDPCSSFRKAVCLLYPSG